jgi:hypothetical protein
MANENQPSIYASAWARNIDPDLVKSAKFETSPEMEERYPDVANVARERVQIYQTARNLQSEAGYGPDTALIQAKNLHNIQKQANAVKIQEDLLAAQDAELQLQNHQKKLNAQARLNSFAKGINEIDHNDLTSFNDKLTQHHLDHLDLFSDPDPVIRKAAEDMESNAVRSNSKAGQYAEILVQKAGLPGITEDVLDPQTGRIDKNRLMSSAVNYRTSQFAQRKKEAGEIAKIGEETRIAVQKAATESRRAALEKDPIYQQKIKLNAIMLKKRAEEALSQEFKNDIIASGISPENAKYLGREIGEGDATGRKVKDATHYIYKNNQGKTFALPKDSVDYIKNKSKQYRSLLDDADKITSQDTQESGQATASEATTDGQNWKTLF